MILPARVSRFKLQIPLVGSQVDLAVVGEAADGASAYEVISALKPHIVRSLQSPRCFDAIDSRHLQVHELAVRRPTLNPFDAEEMRFVVQVADHLV